MKEKCLLGKLRIFSGSTLKLIAVIAMLVDHAALVLCYNLPVLTLPLLSVLGKEITLYYIMHKIGRLAFPIFCFLIGEGFVHTRNGKKYTQKLLLFALLSELPFDLMVGGKLLYWGKQNVFFTLFLGALAIYTLESDMSKLKKGAWLLGILAASILLRVDYGPAGVVLILLMYILRDQPAVQAVAAFPLLSNGFAALAAFIPINMYNGKRGFIKSGALKYAFYLFYPLHMLILLGIKGLLIGI